MDTESRRYITKLKQNIAKTRKNLYQVQNKRDELETLRETYAQGRDDYNEVLQAIQTKMDGFEADIN
jgi:uncharacterized coiled-coil DUF342 family protein